MAGEIRVARASVQYEESPAEDPDGPFLNKPCLKFFLSLAFHEPSGAAVTPGTRFLLSWSAKLIFVRTVMRTIARVWAPETGAQIPNQPTAMEFQFRLPLSKGAATALRRSRRALRKGQLEVRVTALQQETVRPVEYVGSFTTYVERIDASNVRFAVGAVGSTLQIVERRAR